MALVNKGVIQNKIAIIENNIIKMETLANLPAEEFLDKFYYIESAKHLLQVSIEAMLDIANHIIARERYRIPKTYTEAINVLVEESVLPQDKGATFVQMAKFRNRVVHLYHEVDDVEIHKILQQNLDDFREFIRAIVTKVI